MEMEKKMMAGCQIPAFGVWNHCNDEMAITQCFDQAMQARLMRRGSRCGRDCTGGERCSAMPFRATPPARRKPATHRVKVIRSVVAEKQYCGNNGVEKMTVGAYGTKRKVAVDEDLYKVPQALVLYQKPRKMRKVVWSLWIGCLGLGCIA